MTIQIDQIVRLKDIFPGSTDPDETMWNNRVVRIMSREGNDAWRVRSFEGETLVVYEHEFSAQVYDVEESTKECRS